MSVKDNTYGIAELQDKMLSILKFFISICEDNNLRYFAGGGTCIGALRHNGFIPWDDDLDVFMPRPDYEKLWKLFGKTDKNGQYKLCRTTREKNYHHRVMQLVDLRTTFINKRSVNEDIEHGVYIDIIPLDARAKTPMGKLGQIKDGILFSVYNIQVLPEFNGGRMQRLATAFLLKLVQNPDKRYRIWSKAEKRMTRYDWEQADEIIELTTALKNTRRPHPKEWFANVIKHEFEDTEICLPIGAEEYLVQGFGKYTTLPPMESRHPRHNTVFIDLDNSYLDYKGVHYLKEKQ